MRASTATLNRRRVVFFSLVGLTIAGCTALMTRTLMPGGFEWIDLAVLAAFAITLPWTAIGFWNAAFGFALMRFSATPEAVASPAVGLGESTAQITSKTALLVCIRNEDPERLVRNLNAMLTALAATNAAPLLHCFLLSDTSIPGIAAEEERLAAQLEESFSGRIAVTYRRREVNTAFKAGNIREFCDRWGASFDYAIVLDADSYMSRDAILRLIRIMQEDARLGIVQTLVVGIPSTSGFARLFQFGMRLGMRSYTLGAAFWQGDCGPYWGHNAIIRLQPFIAHCDLPNLPNGKVILSHDQVEAVLMRRAGYEVRVYPVEDGSWEENPTTLTEFIRRDLRWCQGNLQYGPLLAMPSLRPVSRFQLVLAMLMFIGSPAWIALVLIASIAGPLRDGPMFDPEYGAIMFATVMSMTFAPKIASLLDLLARPAGRRGFGGFIAIVASTLAETLFTTILAPIMAVANTVFMAGLPFGRGIGWMAQQRDDHSLPFGFALRRLWTQTVLGVAGFAWFLSVAPGALAYAIPFITPLAFSVPFALLTAHPAFGRVLTRIGIGRLPEEMAPPAALDPLALPAVAIARSTRPAAVESVAS